jgi:hypothetical protein
MNRNDNMAKSVDPTGRTSVWRWLAMAFCLFAMTVLVLPTFLGARWIYEPLLQRLAAGDFQLAVGSVQLRWFTPLVLRDLAVTELDGPELLRIREVRTDRGLLAAIWSGRRIGSLQIIDPRLEIELLTDGSNLTRLIEAMEGKLGKKEDAGKAVPSKPPSIDLDVIVTGLTVRVQQEDGDRPLVVIPPLSIAAAYRAADGGSTLHVEPTQLLDEVAVTPELMRLGLGYAIPLLAKSAWFDGRLSIATGAIDIPLDDPKQATGTATITLHEVRSGPAQPAMIQVLDLMAQVRGRQPQHEFVFIDGSKIDIQVANQHVTHAGLKLGLPRIDPRLQLASAGSVGLENRALDMIVEFPVPVEQLAKRAEVREIGVPMIKLPIHGTLDEPRVEWSALRGEGADLLGMIRDRIADEAPATAAVLGGLEGLADGQADQAIGAAVDLLRELRKARQTKKEPDSNDQDILPEGAEPKKPASKQPILDALKKRLRGESSEK